MIPSRTEQEKISTTRQPTNNPPIQPKGQSMQYAIANLQGLGTRDQQQDAFAFGNALDEDAISRKGLLAVVADGMGGMEGGRMAGLTVIAEILSDFERFTMAEDLPARLNEAVGKANDAVFEKLGGAGGSTVVLGLIFREKLYFTSVGDSYLFLLHDRMLTQLNHRQTVLNRDLLEQIQEGRMDPYEARQNPEKNAITQFLGMPTKPDPDYLKKPLTLVPGDVLLFCSDGVGGVLEPACLEACLCCSHPEAMCEALEREIRKRNMKYQDNYTALIIQCKKNLCGFNG